jgi:hypothetical protein
VTDIDETIGKSGVPNGEMVLGDCDLLAGPTCIDQPNFSIFSGKPNFSIVLYIYDQLRSSKGTITCWTSVVVCLSLFFVIFIYTSISL